MRFTIALFALLLSGFASAQVSQIAVNAAPAPEGYDLRVETVSEDIGELAGLLGSVDMTGLACYRVYVVMFNEDDFLSSISGDAINPTYVNTSTSFYQAALGGLLASASNSALFPIYPDLEYDSYVTIGLTGPADGTAGEANPSTVQSGDNAWATNFDPLGGNISIDDAIGGAWYALNGDANGVAGPALEVLAGQFTTSGELSGQMYAQVFINGDGQNEFRDTFTFGPQAAVPGCTDAAACNFDAEATENDDSCEYPVDIWGSANVDCAGDCISDLDGDGVCSEDDNCEDLSACNYDDAGNGACESLDDCDVCGGSGIPAGDCDCEGNQLDVCGDCGGSGTDTDGDGLCDADDNCTDLTACNYDDAGNGACESLDECDVCGGSGIPAGDCDCDGNVLDECDVCGGSGIPDGDCDCDGNQLDACGVCDGDNSSCAGCIDESACDYDPDATVQAYGEADGGALSFSWTSVGSYPGEISWDVDGGVPYAAGDEPTLDLAEGTYTITGYDSYGDGWNGGELVITDVASGASVALAVSGSEGSVDITVTGQEAPALCEYESCAGCTDDTACNYDDTATIDEGCTYPQNDLVDCDNVCLDGGVLYEFSITDQYSDGMCCGYGEGYYSITAGFVEVGAGSDFGAGASHVFCAPADVCVQLTFVADNYPGEQDWTMSADGVEVGSGDGNDATYNYGTCVEGCMDDTACNFNADANIEGTCEYPIDIHGVSNVDCDGACLNDADGDGVCDEDEAAGCTDETACNAADFSDTDNSTCIYAEDIYDCNRDCDGACNNDADADDVCDECEIDGCTETEACNFDAGATDNDGSCEYPIDLYGAANLDCAGACLAGDTDGDGVCDDDELEGCQEEDACNYDAAATDAGACDYPIDLYGIDYVDCAEDCLNDADGDGICDEDEDLDEVVDIVNGALGGTLDSSATILGDLINGGIASGDLADALDGLGIGFGPESAEQSSIALVVSVDVSCSGITDVTSVRMTGPWWGWDPNGGPVASDNGDGTWSAVFDPAPGANMEYLWVVNGVQENLISSMVDGGACAPVTDYWSYANRLWDMGSANPSDTYGQCDACDSDPGPDPDPSLTVSVDVSCSGTDVTSVRMTGPWWGWDPNGGPVASDNGDGTWSAVFDPAPEANMEYLWVVNGVQENLISSMQDGGACAPVTDYWSYANRLWDMGSANPSDTYGQCDACASPCATIFLPTDAAWASAGYNLSVISAEVLGDLMAGHIFHDACDDLSHGDQITNWFGEVFQYADDSGMRSITSLASGDVYMIDAGPYTFDSESRLYTLESVIALASADPCLGCASLDITVGGAAIEDYTVECESDLDATGCSAAEANACNDLPLDAVACERFQFDGENQMEQGGGSSQVWDVLTAGDDANFNNGPDALLQFYDINGDMNQATFFVEDASAGGVILEQFENGTAIMSGAVVDAANPSRGLNIHLFFEGRTAGADWTGGFKNDYGCSVTTDLWTMYTMNDAMSYATGRGDWQFGTLIHFAHQPATQHFGYQLGDGANNHNCEDDGFSGWFSWTGSLGGESATGFAGDVIAELDPHADYPSDCVDGEYVELHYIAFDDACSIAEHIVQRVTRDDNTAPTHISGGDDITLTCDESDAWLADNQAADETVLFTDNCDDSEYGCDAGFDSNTSGFADGNDHFVCVELIGQFTVQYTASSCRTLERRWVATDCHGNQAIHIQTIVIEDNTNPVAEVEAPGDIVLNVNGACYADFTPSNTGTAATDYSDNCDLAATGLDYADVIVDSTSTGCYSIIRTWTAMASDSCGNGHIVTDDQRIDIQDLIVPSFAGLGVDTIECDLWGDCSYDYLNSLGLMTVTDNCEMSHVDVDCTPLSAACTDDYVVDYTATDMCGNVSTFQQIIVTADRTAPEWSYAPADLTHQCSDAALDGIVMHEGTDYAVPVYTDGNGMAEAIDNCDPEITVTYSDEILPTDCDQEYTIKRTYSVPDCDENVAEHVQYITVEDTTAPEFTAFPADLDDVECDAVPAIADLGTLAAADNCDPAPSIVFVSEVRTDGESGLSFSWTSVGSYAYEISWEVDGVTYAAGDEPTLNLAAGTYTINGYDSWGDGWNGAELVITDIASGTSTTFAVLVGEYASVDITVSAACVDKYTLARTWETEDCAGNTHQRTQTIEVVDTTAPELAIECPGDILYSNVCHADGDLSLETNGIVTWEESDNCDADVDVSYTYADVTVYDCTADDSNDQGSFTVTRTFTVTAVDNCGNTTVMSCDQVLTFTDEESPVMTDDVTLLYPAAIACEDFNDPYDVSLMTLTATDNCDDSLTFTVVEAHLTSGSCPGTWIRHWVATDDCGNVSDQAIQYVATFDLTNPVTEIDCPSDVTLTQDEDCYVDLSTDANGYATYSATDNCDDNLTTWIDYEDSEHVYTCGAGAAEVSSYDEDNGGDVSSDATNPMDIPFAGAGDYLISGSAGNYQTANADPEYFTIEIPAGYELRAVRMVEFDQVGYEPAGEPAGNGGFFGIGNGDAMPPIASPADFVPAANALFGGALVGILPGAQPGDNVLDDLASPFEFPAFGINIPGFSGTLGAGTYSFFFKEGNAHPDVVDAYVNWSFALEIAAAGDDDNLEGSFTFTRTFTASATDECGNNHTVSCDQDLTVIDDLAPLLEVDCPAYQNLINVCFKDVDTTLAGLGSPQWTVSDNCDSDVSVSFTYVDVVTFQCSMIGVDDSPEGSYKLRRTFTTVAVDDCGNSTTVVCEQIVNTFDLISPEPEINCPDAATVQLDENCETDSSPAVTGNPTATATDNCDTEVTITYSYSDSAPEQICGGDQSGSYTFTRTWTATAEDDCNNDASVSCDQLITVLDEIQPEPAIVCPDDATIYTDEDCLTDVSPESTNGYATGSATDNCDPNVTIEISYEDGQRTYDCSYDDNIAEGSYHFTRTWTSVATDDCGNTDSITCDQLITALDTITPVQDFPELTTDTLYLDMDCAVDMTPSVYPVATYSDNCDTDVENTVSYEDNPENFSALFGEMGVSIEAVAEHTTGDLAGMTTYRVYATLAAEGDFLSSVSGEGAFSTQLRTTTSFYQHDFGGATPNTISALLYPVYPDLEYDSWVTIGLESMPDLVAGEGMVNIAEPGGDTWASTVFEGGGDIVINSSYGGAWYALNGDSNGLADEDGRVLVAQLTTDGSVNGQLFLQVFPQGDGSNQILRTVTFGDECAGDDSVTEGSFVTTRVWRSDISDDCGNSSTTYTYQNIVVLDTIAPQFTETCDISNGEQVEYTCGDDNENGTNDVLDFIQLPAACAPSYMENCDSEVPLTMVSDSSGYVPTNSIANYCMPSTVELLANNQSCDDRDAESIRLFNFAGGESFTIVDGGASLVEVMSGDSALHIVLETENAAGDAGFTFDAMYEGSFDWNAWLDQPGLHSYKKDCAELYPGIEIWTEWLYYVMANGTMEGTGRFAGSSFTLSHQPMNNYYGLQVGLGANNKNENYGASAWFFWSGEYVLDGASQGTVASSGDIFMDLDCCLGWQVNYEYTIVDDCGNSSGYGYSNVGTGEFGSGANSTVGGHVPTDISTGLGGFKEPIRITGLQPNPTNDYSTLGFVVSSDMRLRIDLYTMNGGFISELYDGNASADAQYILDVDASDLSSGMYQIRLSSNSYVLVKKLLVTE